MNPGLQIVAIGRAPAKSFAASCNAALTNVGTRYVAFVAPGADGDARFAAEQVNILEQHPELAAICRCSTTDNLQTFTLRTLIERTPPLRLSGAIIRRDALVAAGGFDEGIRSGCDFDLWLRLARRGESIGASGPAAGDDLGEYGEDPVARIESQISVLERFAARYLMDQPTRMALRARIMWLIDRLEIEQAKCRMREGHVDAAAFHLASARRPTWQVRLALVVLRLTPRLARAVYRAAPALNAFL